MAWHKSKNDTSANFKHGISLTHSHVKLFPWAVYKSKWIVNVYMHQYTIHYALLSSDKFSANMWFFHVSCFSLVIHILQGHTDRERKKWDSTKLTNVGLDSKFHNSIMLSWSFSGVIQYRKVMKSYVYLVTCMFIALKYVKVHYSCTQISESCKDLHLSLFSWHFELDCDENNVG